MIDPISYKTWSLFSKTCNFLVLLDHYHIIYRLKMNQRV